MNAVKSSMAALALGLAAGLPVPLAAQEVVSREVVQALPSNEVQRLNRALVALAKAPRDRDALIEAGTAAIGVDDLEAAIGFFGRAAEVDPGHPQVAKGLASVYLRSGRAGEALVQFDRALAAGVPERDILTDQALTFDMVGEHSEAQRRYIRALELDPGNAEARRRLAVSYAIGGNRARFEETLRPLLDARDMAAQRSRAFGLAILGDSDRAAAIVEQIMPRDLATRFVPYLGFMPRLTRPQQAAAANLGLFPRAADIGRDDPRLARFAGEARTDSRLTPAGPALDTPAPRRVAAAPASPPAPAPVTVPPQAGPPTRATVSPAPGEAFLAVAAPVPSASTPTPPQPVVQPPQQPAPVPAIVLRQPEPDAPAPARSVAAAPRVADAFADLAGALPDARVGGNAVDITRIAVKREAPPPPPEKPKVKDAPKPKEPVKAKEPPKPVHPSRVWVQVATGRNVKALGFDWRRIAKEGGAPLAKLKPHSTRWGEANRLLAGPIDTRDKAQALVRELKAKGIDSFIYISPEGEEIQPVK